MTTPALPPGFQIDDAPPLPPGFQLDGESPDQGRGKINPPLAADRREVGIHEALVRGGIRGLGHLATGVGRLVAGPVEQALHATNSPHEGKAFAAADDFAKWGEQAAALPEGAEMPFSSRVAETVGEGVPLVGSAIVGGPAVAGVLGGGSSASNTFAEGLNANLNTAANIAKTVIAGVGGAVSGYLPGSIGASLPAKLATGAAINVGSGEVQRQAGNAVNAIAGRSDLNQEFSPEAAAGQAITGGALAAAPHVLPAAAKVAGKVADVATPLVGAAGRKVLNVDPELAKVAQTAQELPYPIHVAPDQVVQNAKFSKLAGQASRDVPLSGSNTVPNQGAFTKNIIHVLNPEETATRLTDVVFKDAMNRSGQGIGDITARTPVPIDDLRSGLDSLLKQANTKETPDNAKIVNAYVDEIHGLVGENGVVDGTALKKLNSEIGLKAQRNAGNDLGGLMNDLQGVIQDGVEKNVTDPADIKALRDFRRQYAYGKILEPSVAKTIDGLASPQALMAQVTSTKLGKHLMAMGNAGPLGDLAKVGQLIKEPGSSLTAERSLVYAGLGGAAHFEPHTAAGIYAAANIYNRAGPKLTRAMVGKRAKPVEPPAAEPPGPPPEPTTSPGPAPSSAAGPGLAETNRLMADNPSPEVRKVLEDHAAAIKQAQRERAAQEEKDAKAAEMERTARTTTDPDLQKKLLAEADKLRGTKPIPKGEVTEGQPPIASDAPTKPIPKGEMIEGEPPAEKVPVGKVTEGQPEIKTDTPKKIPAGKATELSPEEEAKWRKTFGLGDGDAQRAKAVATALAHDEPAVEAAAVQHENSPRAFDREIERINEEAKNANESQRAAEGSESPADAGSPPVRPDEGGDAPVRAGEADRPVPAAESGTGGKPEPEPAATVRATDEQPGADSVPAAGRGDGAGADTAGGQAPAGEKGASRLSSAEWRDQGKTPEQLIGDKVRYEASELARQVAEEAKTHDFAPSEMPQAVRDWATNSKVPADDLRQALLKALDDADISPARKAQVIAALDPTKKSFVPKGKTNGPDPQPDNQPGDLQQKAGEKGVPKDEPPEEIFSSSIEDQQKAVDDYKAGGGDYGGKPAGSPETLESWLREDLGNKLIDGLLEHGLIKYALARDEGMVGSKSDVKAIMRQKPGEAPAATLYFDRITRDRAPGILMHELGEHFGIVRMLGGERYRVILNELENLRDAGSPEVSEAWDHVKDNYVDKPLSEWQDLLKSGRVTQAQFDRGIQGTASKLVEGGDVFMREVAARLVESHPDLPWVRRLINEVRAFFYEQFGTTMGNRVDANLVRGLAASALRKASTGGLAGQRPTARQFKPLVPSRTVVGDSANRAPPTP